MGDYRLKGKINTEIKDKATGENQNTKRETVFTKGITRTIQTSQFFSLTIQHIAQDTIEWATIEEREKKQESLTKLLVKNFIQTHDEVLDKLKLGQMHAFARDHIKESNAKKTPELIGVEDLDEIDE